MQRALPRCFLLFSYLYYADNLRTSTRMHHGGTLKHRLIDRVCVGSVGLCVWMHACDAAGYTSLPFAV